MDESKLIERTAQLIAHRACIGAEHDPAAGKLHGYCVVCGIPWPCAFAGKPLEATSYHIHLAKYDEAGRLTDECGRCGKDLRDPIHFGKSEDFSGKLSI